MKWSATENLAWKADLPDRGNSTPVVWGDRIFVMSPDSAKDQWLLCVNRADGKELWSVPTRGKVDSSPVVAGDKVVVGSSDGRLYIRGYKNLWCIGGSQKQTLP